MKATDQPWRLPQELVTLFSEIEFLTGLELIKKVRLVSGSQGCTMSISPTLDKHGTQHFHMGSGGIKFKFSSLHGKCFTKQAVFSPRFPVFL